MEKLIPHHWPRVARRAVGQLDWPGAVGIGLLVFCGTAYLSAFLPAQRGLEEARQRAELAVKGAARGTGPKTPADQLAAFYRFFPEGRSEPDWLEKIYQAAQEHGLSPEQGEYRAVRDKVGRLVRLQVTLPLTGAYPELHGFLAQVLSEAPTVSLDGVDFTRQKIGDGSVEAKVRFSLYLK